MYELERFSTFVWKKCFLALPSIPSDYKEPTVICKRNEGEGTKRPLELAGRACFDKHEYVADIQKEGDVDDSEPLSSPRDGLEDGQQGANKKQQRKQAKLKLSEDLENLNLYTVLGVRDDCNPDDLRKAYRTQSLVLHPDKHAEKSEDEQKRIANRFVMMTDAVNILSDVNTRRQYDSTLPFDESVPSKVKAEDCEDLEEFLELFGPVFERNAKFSTKKAPLLPGADASIEIVQAFYKFWFSFDSWRNMDLKILEEEGDDVFADTKDAECREEKRWMERENMRIRKKFLAEEHSRVRGLVDLADKHDPRIKAQKEAIFAKKNAAKFERERIAREAEEKKEREAREAEEKALAEEEQKKAAKAALGDEKQAQKKVRQQLKALVRQQTQICPDQFNEYVLTLEINNQAKLLKEFEDAKPASLEAEITARFQTIGWKPTIVESTAASEEEVKETAKPVDPKILKKQEEQRKKEEKKRLEEEKRKEEEKKVRDAKREELEAKKAAEKAKKDAAKVEREAKEKAEKTKQEAAKKATVDAKKEAEKEKQRAIAAEQNKKIQEEKEKVNRNDRYNMDRSKLLENYGNDGSKELKETLEEEGMDIISWAKNIEDEDLAIDAVCSMIATRNDGFRGFLLGKRLLTLEHPHFVDDVNQNVRNKGKKVRQQIRTLVKEKLATATKKTIPAEFKEIAAGEFPLEGWEIEEKKQPQAQGGGNAAGGGGKKKKPAKKQDEDLDAILKEFDEEPSATGKKKKGKK